MIPSVAMGSHDTTLCLGRGWRGDLTYAVSSNFCSFSVVRLKELSRIPSLSRGSRHVGAAVHAEQVLPLHNLLQECALAGAIPHVPCAQNGAPAFPRPGQRPHWRWSSALHHLMQSRSGAQGCQSTLALTPKVMHPMLCCDPSSQLRNKANVLQKESSLFFNPHSAGRLEP